MVQATSMRVSHGGPARHAPRNPAPPRSEAGDGRCPGLIERAHDGVPRPSQGRVIAIAHGRWSAKTDWGGSLQSAPRTDPERAGRRRRSLNGASCRRRPHPAPARRADPRARHAKAVPRRILRRSRSHRGDQTHPDRSTRAHRRTADFTSRPVSRARATDAREKRPAFSCIAWGIGKVGDKERATVAERKISSEFMLPRKVGGPFNAGFRARNSRESAFPCPWPGIGDLSPPRRVFDSSRVQHP